MGKGGTRFVADAIDHRDGRQRSTFSARELRRDMDTFCETGVHPDIEKAIQDHEENPAEEPLPLFDHRRPFVYLEFSISKEPVGRITIELFVEHFPRGVEILQRRCKTGSQQSLVHTRVHKLLNGCAFFIGSPRKSFECIVKPELNHTDRGAVSLSVDGNEIAVTLNEDALALDESHQILGRVHLGMEVLDRINAVLSGPQDRPLEEILITRCGITDHIGESDLHLTHRSQSESSEMDLVQQLEQDTEEAKEQLKSALEEGLSRKRKQINKELNCLKSKKHILDQFSSSSDESD